MQTAKSCVFVRREVILLIHEALDLEFPLADSRSFVPMKLRFSNRTIWKLYVRKSLSLPPAAVAIEFRNRRISRIAFPIAKVSISENSPQISKNTSSERYQDTPYC
jgi:hypothetical protein